MTRRGGFAIRRTTLLAIAAAFGLTACGGADERPALPPFANELAGSTAVVVWSQDTPLPQSWLAALGGLAEQLPGTLLWRVHRPELASLAVDPELTGWERLSAAPPFQEGIAALRAPAASRAGGTEWPLHAWANLQLAGDALLPGAAADAAAARGGGRAPAWVTGRLADALFLSGFRWAAVAARERDGALDLRGSLATTGTREGLPGLLVARPGDATATPMLEPAPECLLHLEARCDPLVPSRMVQRLTEGEGGTALGWLGQTMTSGVLGVVARVCEQLDGRFAAQAFADRVHLVAGARDTAALRQLLDAHLLPDGDGWKLPFGARLELHDGVLHATAPPLPTLAAMGTAPEHPRCPPPPAPLPSLWAAVPVLGVVLSVDRPTAAADTLALTLTHRR